MDHASNELSGRHHLADHDEGYKADHPEEQRHEYRRERALDEQRQQAVETDVEVDHSHALRRRLDDRHGRRCDFARRVVLNRLWLKAAHGLSPSRWLTGLGIVALAFLSVACSTVRPLLIATHFSDPSDGGVSDTTFDFAGAGVTAELGAVSIDAALGRKAINCEAFVECSSQLGGMATVRWSPR